MVTRRASWAPRLLVFLASGASLCALGPCGSIAHTSVIQGFFDVVNPMLIDRLAQDLGVQSDTAAGAPTYQTGADTTETG